MQTEKLLRPKQVYDKATGYIPCSRAKYYQLIKKGVIPEPIKLGSMTFHPESDILAAVAKIKADAARREAC